MYRVKSKIVSGIIWNSLDRFSMIAIQLCCTLIIARFLTPSDFGLIGILNVFSALGTLLIDSGFTQALIRKPDASTTDYTSIFYFNILLGSLVYIVFFELSPYIALYYSMPEIENISKVLYLVLPINSFSLIQTTILQKRMNFKLLSKISVVSALLSGLIAITLSYIMKNVWALVAQMLLYHIFRVCMLWIYTDWKPSKKISVKPIIEMAPFSFNLLLSGAVSIVFDNMYTILIGKYYKLIDLGLYSQSKKMAEMPSVNLTAVIQQVTYSSMSVYQHDVHRLRDNYMKTIRLSVYVITPIMSFLIINATLIFDVVLGEKWMNGVEFFQLMCLIGVFYPLNSISLNILKITGNSKDILYLELLKKIILFLLLIFTINFSLIAVLYGNVIYVILSVLVNLYYCGRKIQITVISQLNNICSSYILGLFISIFNLIIVNHVINRNELYILPFIIIVYISVWIFLSYALKLKAFDDLLKIIK